MLSLALNVAAFIFLAIIGLYAVMLVLSGIAMAIMKLNDAQDWANAKLHAWEQRKHIKTSDRT